MKNVKCICGSDMTKLNHVKEIGGHIFSGTDSYPTSCKLFVSYRKRAFFASKTEVSVEPDIFICEECGRVEKILNKENLDKIKEVEKLLDNCGTAYYSG